MKTKQNNNNNKTRFALKKVFYWAWKISDFGLKKKKSFFVRNSRKGVFFKLGYERGIRFGREWEGRSLVGIVNATVYKTEASGRQGKLFYFSTLWKLFGL